MAALCLTAAGCPTAAASLIWLLWLLLLWLLLLWLLLLWLLLLWLLLLWLLLRARPYLPGWASGGVERWRVCVRVCVFTCLVALDDVSYSSTASQVVLF